MKIKLDEMLPAALVEILSNLGHDFGARSDDSDDYQTNRRNRLTWHGCDSWFRGGLIGLPLPSDLIAMSEHPRRLHIFGSWNLACMHAWFIRLVRFAAVSELWPTIIL